MRVKNGKRREKKGKERSGEIGAATEGPNNTDIKIQEATPGVAVSFNFTNRLTIQDPRPEPEHDPEHETWKRRCWFSRLFKVSLSKKAGQRRFCRTSKFKIRP